jgi:hypothetical protein
MGPVASAALRSGIIAVAVWALFVLAGLALDPTPWEYKPRDLPFIALKLVRSPALWAATVIGWLVLWRRFVTTESRRSPENRSTLGGVIRESLTILALSLGVFVLVLATLAVPYGWPFRTMAFSLQPDEPIRYVWTFPDRYLVRLFLATLFAVAIVRTALPLLPRFDRMPPRNA